MKVKPRPNRRFFIISDDIETTKNNRGEELKRFEFAEDMCYILMDDLLNDENTQEELKERDNSQYVILFLNDTTAAMDDVDKLIFVMNAVMFSVVDFIICEDGKSNKLKLRTQSLYGDKVLSNLRRKLKTFDELVKHMDLLLHPANTIIGFISDNDKFMNNLFDGMKEYVEEEPEDDDDSEPEQEYVETRHPYHTKGLPKLFEGWIWRVWYGKDKDTDKINTEAPDEEFDDSTTESYVTRTIIVKTSEYRTITYIWIKPNKDLDLTNPIKECDTVYFDLTTYYANIVLDDQKIGGSRCSFRYFVSVDSGGEFGSKCRKSEDFALNVMRNYLHYSDLEDFAELHLTHDYEDVHNDACDKSKSVFISDLDMELRSIAIIEYIEP